MIVTDAYIYAIKSSSYNKPLDRDRYRFLTAELGNAGPQYPLCGRRIGILGKFQRQFIVLQCLIGFALHVIIDGYKHIQGAIGIAIVILGFLQLFFR